MVTLLETQRDLCLLKFWTHNLNNLAGAKWICQNMGVDEAEFYEAIASFKGPLKTRENCRK
jgi:UDP-N-acetylmuramate: L-alanyl-gamma-D-glutamyl-meso-diaminopimelate ligase